MALTRDTSLQAEYRLTDTKTGDLLQNFDPDLFAPTFREHDRIESIRVGGRHSFAPSSTLLGSFIYQWANADLTFGSPLQFRTEQNGFTAESLYLYRSERLSLAGGLGTTLADRKDVLPSFDSTTNTRISHAYAYLYTYLNFFRSVTVTTGLGGDRFRGGIVDRDDVNPKFGVTWNPIPATTVRVAAFRTLNRTLTASQTLEPTQVAGFNQFYADSEGTRAWRYGAGVDQKFSSSVFAGVEQSWRRLDVPGQTFGPGSEVITANWKEQLSRAYLYWAPLYWLSVGLEYQYERFTRDPDFFNLGEKTDIETHRIPLGVNVFLPWGFISRWKATYVDQHGDFATAAGTVAPGSDRFWLLDGSVGYRLPWRLGLVSFEARNLLDKRFRFQDTDPSNPRIRPERLFLGRLILAY
jgi:opacity protein-like surface antigen